MDKDVMNSDTIAPTSFSTNSTTEQSVVRAGAFSKRRNPLPSDPPENDNNNALYNRIVKAPLHYDQVVAPASDDDDGDGSATSRGDENKVARHQQLEWEYYVRSRRKTKLLLSTLIEVTPRGNLAFINLSRRGIGNADTVLIREAIQSNPNLVVLKVPYNNIGDDGVSMIATAICIEVGKKHRNLSILDLSFNNVGDTGCGSIALHCVAGNINLQSLCLTGNQFGSDGVSALAASISHGTGLRNLYLSVNSIGTNGIKDIAGAVTKNESRIYQLLANGSVDSNTVRPTEELHLDNTDMSSDGLSAISLMVLFNSSLRTLSLCSNNLDDKDLMLLSQAIAQNNKQMPLESLLLSFNQITCLGVECLMNSLWGSTTLRELKLDNNKINDRGVQLCAVVLTSIDLHTLDLSFNKATAIGVKALMKALAENTSLQSLALSGIPIDLISSKAISYALAYNTALKALYLDNCSTGFASQRHVVAGALSNAKSSLRTLTGFCISQIAITLGMPWLPEAWTNDQTLNFVRYMWEKWLLKSKSVQAGPAPPAAIATASKIAFATLGPEAVNMLKTEDHEKPLREGASVEPCGSVFLERTASGTLSVPMSSFSVEIDTSDSDVRELATSTCKNTVSVPSAGYGMARAVLHNPERRNLNVNWLRHHFRSLSDVGRLPFHNADLWQLHQYFFSPPFRDTVPPVQSPPIHPILPEEQCGGALVKSDDPQTDLTSTHSVSSNELHTLSFDHEALVQTFADAISGHPNNSSAPHGTKRSSFSIDTDQEELGHTSKKVKNTKPRIEYYPRIMKKLESLGTKPFVQTLSLLRQLKYTESALLSGKKLYDEDCNDGLSYATCPSYDDVEMILLDIL